MPKTILTRIALYLLPVIAGIALLRGAGLEIKGWEEVFAIIYLPFLASITGLVFLAVKAALQSFTRMAPKQNLATFIYGFYFGAALLTTLMALGQ